MPNLLHRLGIISCRNCISVLSEVAEVSDDNIKKLMYNAIYTINDVIEGLL